MQQNVQKATKWPTPPIREGGPETQEGGRKKGKPVPEEKVVRQTTSAQRTGWIKYRLAFVIRHLKCRDIEHNS